ncbi:MAG: hypothetical protein EXS03_07770, partial [Phycisphaerales bacterium]|nr:hypothetical protein [Phycisphaerales bacterium]
MAHELYYTSAPRGLRPQTSGFCTVGMTAGFPAPFIPRLEALSGYKPPQEGAEVSECPTAWSHWIVAAAGLDRHVLSAVGRTAPDHTGRSNKIAHHLLLHASELVSAGPAWLIGQHGVMESRWIGEPRVIDHERRLPAGHEMGSVRCSTWEGAGGDAGWAGVIANAALLDPSRPCSVVYPDGVDALALIQEAMLLLPAEWRWRVTFTSYFMQPVAGLRCTWRFCVDGTEAAAAARASSMNTIDLCLRAPCTHTGKFIDMARTGRAESTRDLGDDRGALAGATPPQIARPAPVKPAVTKASGTREKRAPIAVDPTVETGIDYVEQSSSRDGRERIAMMVAVAVAALFLVTTVTFFALWMKAAGAPGAAQQGATAPSGTAPESDAKTMERQRDAAEARADTATAQLNDLKGQLAQAETNLAAKDDLIAQQYSEIELLKRKTQPTVAPAEVTAPGPGAASGQSFHAAEAHEPTVAPDASSATAPVVATVNVGPVSATAWLIVELPKPARSQSGDWNGAGTWPIAKGVPVRKVVWAPGSVSTVKGFVFEGSKVFTGSGDAKALVAEIAAEGEGVRFSWKVAVKDSSTKNLKVDDVSAVIKQIPMHATLENDESVWLAAQRLDTRQVGPKEVSIGLRDPEEPLVAS